MFRWLREKFASEYFGPFEYPRSVVRSPRPGSSRAAGRRAAPTISAVVCTRDPGADIEDCLLRLARQSLQRSRYEIVVVDNGSDGEATERLEALRDRFDLRLVREDRLGLSHARNHGVQAATGDVLLFIDDDAMPDIELLERLAEVFAAHDPDAAGGPVHGVWSRTPPRWLNSHRWCALSLLSLGPDAGFLEWPAHLIGTNIAFKRSVFERFGMFEANLGRKGDLLIGGEEVELQRRIVEAGGTLYYDPRLRVFHKVPPERMTFEYFYRRQFANSLGLFRKDPRRLTSNRRVRRPNRLAQIVRFWLSFVLYAYRLYRTERRLRIVYDEAVRDAREQMAALRDDASHELRPDLGRIAKVLDPKQ